MKPSEIVDLLADMEAAWRDMTPEKKKLYAEDLMPLGAATTRAAVRRLIRTSRFLPTIAEIRTEEREERGVHPDVRDGYVRYALGPGEPEEMTPEQREQWEALKTMLREKPVGRPYPKAFDDMPDEVFQRHTFRLDPRDIKCGAKGHTEAFIDGVPCCAVCKEPTETELVGFKRRTHFAWPGADRALCGQRVPVMPERPAGTTASCSRCDEKERDRQRQLWDPVDGWVARHRPKFAEAQ